MGKTLQIICPKCGEHFDWNTGTGFLGIEMLHCNRCGKEKQINEFDIPYDGDLDCECGGVFTENATIRCPKCQTKIDKKTKSNATFLLWD